MIKPTFFRHGKYLEMQGTYLFSEYFVFTKCFLTHTFIIVMAWLHKLHSYDLAIKSGRMTPQFNVSNDSYARVQKNTYKLNYAIEKLSIKCG